jgi:hypothetical protein
MANIMDRLYIGSCVDCGNHVDGLMDGRCPDCYCMNVLKYQCAFCHCKLTANNSVRIFNALSCFPCFEHEK